MRILTALMGFLIVVSCQQKETKTPSTAPIVDERIGIYKQATAYAASTDYEFEVNGKSILVRVSRLDSLLSANVPANLIVPSEEGPEMANPLLIGKKYKLTFDLKEHLKSIQLMGNHDPANPELPGIPEVYSGLLSIGPEVDSRAYLNIFSDLTALLLIYYEAGESPVFKQGRWTRTDNGQKISAQFGEEDWLFQIRKDSLMLISRQMGSGGLTLTASPEYDFCHYVRNWLSNLSTTDGQQKVEVANITNQTPLSDVLGTEHAYMSLYGELETVFNVSEENINQILRKNPSVQGVCDLVLQVGNSEEEH